VGGTNGKGSVIAILDGILRAAGYVVGRFTSPELDSPRDRIVVDGDWITEPELANIAALLLPELETTDDPPSAFEAWTAIAFEHFRRANVDVGLLEVGLGGRFDATNVVQPMVSVITNVTLDHTAILGNTIERIAWEKAGIVKPAGVIVVGGLDPAARRVIEQECERLEAHLIEGLEIEATIERRSLSGTEYKLMRTGFPERLRLPLISQVQGENLAVALRVIEELRKQGIRISEDAVSTGVSQTAWPGRLEVVEQDPVVLLDGAHNEAAAHALAHDVERLFPDPACRRLVLGVLSDKDVPTMIEVLAGSFETASVCRSQSPRAMDPAALADLLREHSVSVTVYDSVSEALCGTLQEAQAAGVIVVAGSLTVVAEARRWTREGYGNAG